MVEGRVSALATRRCGTKSKEGQHNGEVVVCMDAFGEAWGILVEIMKGGEVAENQGDEG
jgi:hypothetical protein